ncbi:MAG: ABC transporter ATP-binding protein [Flavobacteriales bacterium]|nr:ABC transporter ATP-binding protein [Flavobacteriales bacterium]
MEEKEKKIKITKSSFKRAGRILRFIQPYKWQYIIGIVILFIGSGVILLFPMLLGQLVNSGNGELSSKDLNTIGFQLIGLMVIQAVCSFLRVSLFVSATQKMLADFRGALYTNIIRLPMQFFSDRRVGEINSRMASDITELEEAFTITVAEFARQVIIIVGGISYLAITSFKLTVLMLSIVPIVAIAAVIFGKFIRKLSKSKQNETANSNVIIEETLQGIANVKSFANEIFEIARYKKSVGEIRSIAMRGGIWRGGFAAFIMFSLFGSVIAVIWYAAVLIMNGELNNGNIIEFIVFSGLIGGSIGGLADRYAQIQKTIGATESLLDLLDEEHEAIEINEKKSFNSIQGNIKFAGVSFRYPSRTEIKVMDNVSFEISQGQQVAIVGPSGSGKSTLISLLMRFYDPNEGSILIDDKSTNSYSLDELRGQMALVPQEVILFGGTIRENIAYGKPDADENEIKQAADKANALNFINTFPEGFDTIVGERGVQLSGGQKQRIAIARAVLKNPTILILDEATSSLDAESEELVQNALDKLMENRTTFVIAHRLSTIRNANKILVIDGGQLIQEGTHEELMTNKDGRYYNLSKLQFNLVKTEETLK